MCIWSRLWREKKPERKRKNLIRLGIPSGKAYAWSRSKKGRWAIAQSPILLTTITLERLQKRGYEMRNEFDLTILKEKEADQSMLNYYCKVAPHYNEPLYTRPAWPALSKAKGYSGVRGALRHNLVMEPPTRLADALLSVRCVVLSRLQSVRAVGKINS